MSFAGFEIVVAGVCIVMASGAAGLSSRGLRLSVDGDIRSEFAHPGADVFRVRREWESVSPTAQESSQFTADRPEDSNKGWRAPLKAERFSLDVRTGVSTRRRGRGSPRA